MNGLATRRALRADTAADIARAREALSDSHTRRLLEHQAAHAATEVGQDDMSPICRLAMRLPSPRTCDAIVLAVCGAIVIVGGIAAVIAWMRLP